MGSRTRGENLLAVRTSPSLRFLTSSRRLSSHTSCVNALAFSSGDGQFLASGGDDLRVKLWDFHQDDVKSPSHELVGPVVSSPDLSGRRELSPDPRAIYSPSPFQRIIDIYTRMRLDVGGVCESVFRYDTSTLASSVVNTSPEAIDHDPTPALRIAFDNYPAIQRTRTSSSARGEFEDGAIRRYDARASRATGLLQMLSEATGVKYHPRMNHLFVTSDNRGNLCLRDERMVFGSDRSEGIVLNVSLLTDGTAVALSDICTDYRDDWRQFTTKITKGKANNIAKPEISSICFDREGERLSVTFLHYLPTIYTVSDPNPIAVCSGAPLNQPLPPGERTYMNSCTMKHGDFGGPGLDYDAFYGAGSDDFRAYIWRVPSASELLEGREEVEPLHWWGEAENTPNVVAFTEGVNKPKFVPKQLDTPFDRLHGHRSIVNTVLFHPRLLHVLTAGIEKDIILHSPTPGSPCTQGLDATPQVVRDMSDDADEDRLTFLRSLIGELSEEDRDEERTIRMFDHILRTEGQADVFETRRWIPASDSSDEGMLDSSSDSSDDDSSLVYA
ncbi:hypothetical protein NMY22_g6964 [Coprinellus aureogranulatus]|nr:hypothetical protein NMY22_g6964 [Coprinellus aureogranulatus]